MNNSQRERSVLPLETTIKLYLVLARYDIPFVVLFIFLVLACGVPATFGTVASLFFIRPFSLVTFLVSFWLVSVALNLLTFLLISRHMSKQPALQVSDYTLNQIVSALIRIIGMIVCPFLLLIVAWFQGHKVS